MTSNCKRPATSLCASWRGSTPEGICSALGAASKGTSLTAPRTPPVSWLGPQRLRQESTRMCLWMASRSNLRVEEVGLPQVHPVYFPSFQVLHLFTWWQAIAFTWPPLSTFKLHPPALRKRKKECRPYQNTNSQNMKHLSLIERGSA